MPYVQESHNPNATLMPPKVPHSHLPEVDDLSLYHSQPSPSCQIDALYLSSGRHGLCHDRESHRLHVHDHEVRRYVLVASHLLVD